MDLAQENPHHGHITGGLQRPRLGAHVAGRLRVALLDSGRWTVDRHSRIPHAEDDWLWGGKTDDCEGWVSAAALDFHARGHCAEGRQLAHTPAPAGSASEGLGDDPWWSSGRDLWTSRSDLSSGADVAASGDLVPGTKVMARYRSSRGRLSREWYPGSVLATNRDGTYGIVFDDVRYRWDSAPARCIRPEGVIERATGSRGDPGPGDSPPQISRERSTPVQTAVVQGGSFLAVVPEDTAADQEGVP